MSRSFVYVYTLTDGPGPVQAAVPAHVEYWTGARLEGYRGGPFADRTGGLILFAAADLPTARALADGDPFVARGLVRDRTLKEWLPQ